MSLFPKHSAFATQAQTPGLPMTKQRLAQRPIAERREFVEVPISQLEDWYRRLDELGHRVALSRESSTRDETNDLRDEVYAFLRG